MIPVCCFCDLLINWNNHGWPGYCSARCRDKDRAERQDRAEHRRMREQLRREAAAGA